MVSLFYCNMVLCYYICFSTIQMTAYTVFAHVNRALIIRYQGISVYSANKASVGMLLRIHGRGSAEMRGKVHIGVIVGYDMLFCASIHAITSARLLHTASTFAMICFGGRSKSGTQIACIPARYAASNPRPESSSTRQFSGATTRRFAAFRKHSGDGFG